MSEKAEPNTKAWIRMEERVQSRNIVVCLTRDYGEILSDDKSKKEIAIIADIVEEELNTRVSKLTGEKRTSSTPPRTPSEAPEGDLDYPEYKICAECGESVKRMESKFKRDDGKPYYYRCPDCKTYKME